MTTTTSVLHSPKIPSTKILNAIQGTFIPRLSMNNNQKTNSIEMQICLNLHDHISFYETTRHTNLPQLRFIQSYSLYADISSIQRYNSLIPKVVYDSLILSLDNNKIVFIQHDATCDDFKTLALYGINPLHSNGKIFSITHLDLYVNPRKNIVLYLFDDNKINILKGLNSNYKEPPKFSKEKYYDTLNGDKYFYPSYNVNFFEKKNIYKIIKIYLPKIYENIYFFSRKEEDIERNNNININDNIISFYILYQDSCMDDNHQQMDFFRSKERIAYVTYNTSKEEIEKFELLWDNADETAFDFFVLEDGNNKGIVLFCPYEIQIINLMERVSYNILLNSIYEKELFDNYYSKNSILYRLDYTYRDKNYDLRNNSYLILTNSAFIFSNSNGQLLFFTFTSLYNKYQLQPTQVTLNNFIMSAPYNVILMPSPDLFFLSSPFADGIMIHITNNEYKIVDCISNYSPIVNFELINDNDNMKMVFTNGYNQGGMVNFAYDKFVYYEIPKSLDEKFDFAFIKSIRFENKLYSSYLIGCLKNGKSVVFKINNNGFENMTDRITFNKESNIISCGVLMIENLNTTSLIVLVSNSDIMIYNPCMNHLSTIESKELFTTQSANHKIKQCLCGTNCIVLSNERNENILVIRFINKQNGINNNENNYYYEKKINEVITMRYRDISQLINSNSILKYNINTKEYLSYYTFLVIYRANQTLDIYDIHSLFYFPRNSGVTPQTMLSNNKISELPFIISSNNTSDDFFKCESDPSVKTLIDCDVNDSLSSETPDTIFFDVLDSKCVLCMLIKNAIVVIYQLFFSDFYSSPYKISFKKIYIEYLQNLNYKEFFMLESSNIFIKFNNICNYPGLLININNNQKFVFEIKGEICIMGIKNSQIKHNFTSFTEYSNEEVENGFLIFENEEMKLCSKPKDYNIANHSLLMTRCSLKRFPVNLNYFTYRMPGKDYFNYKIPGKDYYCYILIEREFKQVQQPLNGNNNVPIYKPSFVYYMTFRNESPKVYDQIEFAENETIVESRIVELPSINTLNNKKRYIAVGVNVLEPKKGEKSEFKAKLQLYEIEKGKFLKVFENKELFKGTISMIHSIHKNLLIGVGSHIYLCQYIPSKNEVNQFKEIDNKTLICCSKILSSSIIMGDILGSVSWMEFRTQNLPSPNLFIIGNDCSNYHSTALDFWVDKEDQEDQAKIGCILCDDRKNGHIFLMEGKPKFEETCDFYLGKVIFELKWPLFTNRRIYYYSGEDGSFGYFVPIKKEVYEDLQYLNKLFYNHLPFRAGCNPKAFFTVKNFPYKKEKGKFIDMRIMKYFMSMPISMQNSICKKLFSDNYREKIIKNINDLIF